MEFKMKEKKPKKEKENKILKWLGNIFDAVDLIEIAWFLFRGLFRLVARIFD